MTRTITNEREAREWLDETLGMKGNSFLTAEQARAIDAFADALADLLNVHGVHPVYVMGVLETMKLQVYSFAEESVEKAVEMAGGPGCPIAESRPCRVRDSLLPVLRP